MGSKQAQKIFHWHPKWSRIFGKNHFDHFFDPRVDCCLLLATKGTSALKRGIPTALLLCTVGELRMLTLELGHPSDGVGLPVLRLPAAVCSLRAHSSLLSSLLTVRGPKGLAKNVKVGSK